MNPTTSGGENSWTPEDAIDSYMDMLRRHLIAVGLPTPPTRDADVALGWSRDDLMGMTASELAAAAYEVSVAAFAVQDEHNRQAAKAERCHTELAKRVGRRLDPTIYNRDDKWMEAAGRDEETWSLWLIRRNALTVCRRLESQAARLADAARAINAMIYGGK